MELERLYLTCAMDSTDVVRGANESADAMDDLSASVERSSTSMAGASDQMSASVGELGTSFDVAAQSGTELEYSINGVSASQGELITSNTNASASMDAYAVDAGEAEAASDRLTSSQDRVSAANSRATISTKETALAMTQVATSAMALYGAYDAVGDAQLALDRANLQVDKSTREVSQAQQTYNAALAKYGEDAIETQLAAENLRIKQEEVMLNTDAAANAQEQYNEKMIMAGITIIPSVISGIDGMSKAWKGLKGLDIAGTIGNMNDVLGAHKTALISAGAGLAAVAVIYGAFTTTSEDTRIALSLLAGGLIAAATAQWIWNASAAFGLGLSGFGLALVGVAAAAAGAVYLASSQYGAEIGSSNSSAVNATRVTGGSSEDANARAAAEGWTFNDSTGYWEPPTGYARGGISTTPQLAAVSEGGEPEIHLTQSNVEAFGLGGNKTLIVYINGAKDVDLIWDELSGRLHEEGF